MTRQAKDNGNLDNQETRSASGPPVLDFDASEFAHFLDDTGWSDEQKAEYITLVWNIVCEFVALGFNVHPVQQAKEPCGKLPENSAESASLEAGVVDSSHSDLIKTFMHLSGAQSDSESGGIINE